MEMPVPPEPEDTTWPPEPEPIPVDDRPERSTRHPSPRRGTRAIEQTTNVARIKREAVFNFPFL
jgi:hypothetical protein